MPVRVSFGRHHFRKLDVAHGAFDPFDIILGLDPRIYRSRVALSMSEKMPLRWLDPRVKPEDDVE